jgi:calcium-dependent protein kinase
MGVLCLKCESSTKEKADSEDEEINQVNNREINLPKQYVDNLDITKKDEEKEPILNFEDDMETKSKASDNNNKDNNNIVDDNNNDKQKSKENKKPIIKKYEKSKSYHLKNKEEDESFDNLLIDKILEEKNRKSNKQFGSVQNPKELDQQTEDNKDKKTKNKADDFIFKRREKKSTTLMENSTILQQLFLAEMSIPISQELLVQQKKGNPSEKYIRGKKIGKGTFGAVYESKNIIFNNKVAMKIIPKDYHMNNSLIKNEIDILRKLSHPNIVRIYEFYESKNCFYLINEFCPEGELYNYINNSTLNEQQLSVIFYQVFSGLKYLHENNILHRDLKPENILISKKETDLLDDNEYFWIQIIDFGTAKIFENDKNEKTVVGSPYYIAPEVLKKDYNEKCDTWSVGVILYMFLVGKPPFNGSNSAEIVESIKTKNYDETNQKFITRSEEVRDLIKHLLEKDKNKRLSAKEALSHDWFKKFNGRKLFGNFQEKEIQPFIDNLFKYTINSKIQQLVIAFLVHNLPQTESSHTILKLFRYFNKSGDCKLTKEELTEGLCKYRDKDEVEENVDKLIFLLDGDNNGYIEYEEFLRACIDKKEILNDEYLKYAFKFLDKENKNLLSAQQINSAFLVGNNKLFEVAINKVINELDQNEDGMINFEEFKQLMLKTMI